MNAPSDASNEKATDPSMPAADGTCYIMKIPAEIRRKIFSASLPPQDEVIHPKCTAARPPRFPSSPRPTATTDLMMVNREICAEVAEVLYEERTFGIHIHPGFVDSGIEFLNIGRQPLQYQTSTIDFRFPRFISNNLFGFRRIKKMVVSIYPSNTSARHNAINTYFMILSLSRLLSRDGEKDRTTSIIVKFITPRWDVDDKAMATIESEWWDRTNNRPRESCIHGIPDIELVLRPFALLSRVHNVTIALPRKLVSHPPTVDFAHTLKRSMMSEEPLVGFRNGSLEMQIESARFALEEYVCRSVDGVVRWGRAENLTEGELAMDLGGATDFEEMEE